MKTLVSGGRCFNEKEFCRGLLDFMLMAVGAGLNVDRLDYGVAWSGSLARCELVVPKDLKIDINVKASQVQPTASGAGAANPK